VYRKEKEGYREYYKGVLLEGKMSGIGKYMKIKIEEDGK